MTEENERAYSYIPFYYTLYIKYIVYIHLTGSFILTFRLALFR